MSDTELLDRLEKYLKLRNEVDLSRSIKIKTLRGQGACQVYVAGGGKHFQTLRSALEYAVRDVK